MKKIEDIAITRHNTFGKVVATDGLSVYRHPERTDIFIKSDKLEKHYTISNEDLDRIIAAVADSPVNQEADHTDRESNPVILTTHMSSDKEIKNTLDNKLRCPSCGKNYDTCPCYVVENIMKFPNDDVERTDSNNG